MAEKKASKKRKVVEEHKILYLQFIFLLIVTSLDGLLAN